MCFQLEKKYNDRHAPQFRNIKPRGLKQDIMYINNIVIFQKDKEGVFTIAHTTYDENNSDNKCYKILLSNNILNVVFVPKNG